MKASLAAILFSAAALLSGCGPGEPQMVSPETPAPPQSDADRLTIDTADDKSPID